MKILMINYEFPPIGGGGGNVTYYISKHLAQFGHEVHVITSKFKSLPKIEEIEGFTVHRVPVLRKSPNVCGIHEMLTYVVSASIYSISFIKKYQPDIIHVFFGIPSGPVAYLLKKLYNIPYVLFLGGRDVPRPHPDPPFYRLMYGVLMPAIKEIWGNAKAVVACSSGLKEMAQKTAGNIPLYIIPDGVDLDKFHSVNKRENKGKIKIIGIGRLIPRKGFDCLIRSIQEIAKLTDKDFCVEIVGDGPLRSDLEKLAKQLNVVDKVIFAGSVPYDKLPESYQGADIFVLSSSAEGMPLVVLEAMASGLPVVATKVQGIDELVKVGESGFLFKPSDYQALGRHLANIINNDSLRLEMGKKCLDIIQNYGWANITENYIKLYGI
ncbi:TPA: glycosyltransferase family 4 protein [bacterium]|nr:glycosyltransferase family 4 protein [bacterium]